MDINEQEKVKVKKQIKRLRKNLRKWSIEYYENDAPIVSDAQYDGAYDTLVKLETEYPEFITPNSQTQMVGGKIDNRFKKIEHKFPMLSLSNAFDEADLFKFDEQIKKAINIDKDIEYVAELKIDGLSIAVLYENGKLIQAVTRGDGIVGEDVTHNVLEIEDIPKTIDYLKPLEVRGEIYMSDKVFDFLNENGHDFANPRNAAAGSLRQLDSSDAKERKLSSFMYMIPNPLEHKKNKHSDSLIFLEKLGFSTNKETRTFESISGTFDFINKLTDKRKKLGYETDGIVIKVNDNTTHEDIGYTSKFPKFMIAFKFPEEISETKLIDIFPTIGRTGRVTYNAKLEPVRIAGSTVSAATLHNADYIREIGINVGDIVKVKKAGEIIPKVLGVSKKENKKPWKESTNCPSCKGKLHRASAEVDQYCQNEDCPQILMAKLEHFVSRDAMNLDGISSEIIRTFISNGLVMDIPSLFELPNKIEEISKLPRFGKRLTDKVINEIQKAKSQELDKLIFGLGIRHVGSKNARILAKRFGTLENIMNASEEDVAVIRALGTKVSQSVVSYFSNDANKIMLQKLKELGVIPGESESPISSKFEGMNFVITGTLSEPRKYFADIIESNNGNVASSISKNTSYLLAGKKAGSKLDKATSLGVKVLNEAQFIEMVGTNE